MLTRWQAIKRTPAIVVQGLILFAIGSYVLLALPLRIASLALPRRYQAKAEDVLMGWVEKALP